MGYARNNCRRFHITDDFSKPEYYEQKLGILERDKPGNWLLTGMSDLCAWKEEWLQATFQKLKDNPQHEAIFLSKRPDLLKIDIDLSNAWFGVTVTRKSELWRLQVLKENVKAKHYHVTFEPLFDDPGEVDLTGIDWIVVGTMTGAMKKSTYGTGVGILSDRAGSCTGNSGIHEGRPCSDYRQRKYGTGTSCRI